MSNTTATKVSGDSPILNSLLAWCAQATPWLRHDQDRLAFDWPDAVAAYAKEREFPVDSRVAKVLTELLPALPLQLFSTNAPAPNYFNGDERSAGLTLATHPVAHELRELLTGWGKEVEKFREVLSREMELAAQQEGEAEQTNAPSAYGHPYSHPYRDGAIQKSLALAAGLAEMSEFHQTLNVRFDLTSRLSVATGDMAHFLADAQSYPYNRPLGRQLEIRHELQQLCRLRLDLMALLTSRGSALDGPIGLRDTTIASLARREQALCRLLHTSAKSLNTSKTGLILLSQRPGYALGLADGTSLPFDLSPYATPGSMVRSYSEDLSDVPLPPQAQMLATAIRFAVPDPYRLTTRHASLEGSAAGRIFVAVTERLQAQLRRIEKEASEAEASVDAHTFAAARDADMILHWAFANAPLATLLLSGFLATYRDGQTFGFALSPWLAANVLCERVLKAAPLTYVTADAVKLQATAEAEAVPYKEPAEAQAQTTGQGIWDKFATARHPV